MIQNEWKKSWLVRSTNFRVYVYGIQFLSYFCDGSVDVDAAFGTHEDDGASWQWPALR